MIVRWYWQALKLGILLLSLVTFFSVWGIPFALVCALLAYFPWYLNWLKRQPGYIYYLANLPGWRIISSWKLFVVTLLYLLPPSFLSLLVVQEHWTDADVTLWSLPHTDLNGLIGIALSLLALGILFTWFTGKWGFKDRSLEVTTQGLPGVSTGRRWLEWLGLRIDSHDSREARQEGYALLGIQRFPQWKELPSWFWYKFSFLRPPAMLLLPLIMLPAMLALLLYGFPLALAAVALAFVPGYRRWLLAKPGYIHRLSRLPGWGQQPGPIQLALVSSLYFAPLSLYCWVAESIQIWHSGSFDVTPSDLLAFLLWAAIGLVAIVFLLLWLLWNWQINPPDVEYLLNRFSSKRREYKKQRDYIDLLYRQGRYSEALKPAEQACNFAGSAFRKDSIRFARCLNDLARVQMGIGNYHDAEQHFQQACDLLKSALGVYHPDYAACLSNLGMLYQEQGDHRKAIESLREVLELQTWILGRGHARIISSMNNLATLYMSSGDLETAELLLIAALGLCLRKLGEHAPLYGTIRTNLAQLYFTKGDYAKAQALIEQLLKLWQRTPAVGQQGYATTLDMLAELRVREGNYAEAESLYRQSLEIHRRSAGEKSRDYALSLNSLAAFYTMRRDFGRAEPLYRQALGIQRAIFGEDFLYHPTVAQVMKNLALLYAATSRTPEAFTMMEQVITIDDQLIGQIFSLSSDYQRLRYATMAQRNLALFLSLILQYDARSQIHVRAAFEAVLRRKAIDAEALAQQREAIFTDRYPELVGKYRELREVRAKIDRETREGAGSEGTGVHRHKLSKLIVRREALEAELSRKSQVSMPGIQQPVSQKAIAAVLPAGTALVEFIRIDLFDFQVVPARRQQARYLAFVLATDMPERVQMIDLGEANSIDQLIADYRNMINKKGVQGRQLVNAESAPAPSMGTEDPGGKLRGQIFDRLSLAPRKYTRLFLAPDGDLTRLPFEVLPLGNGRYIIDDYHICYLSAARDVLRFTDGLSARSASALVAASPDFDLSLDKAQLRGMNGSKQSFPPLEALEEEGRQIAAILNAQLLLGEAVLKETITKCRSPYILHLATHGFFEQGQEQRGNTSSGEMTAMLSNRLDQLMVQRVQNPLLHSGLALAGANIHAVDGILTAEDVTGMNLLDTQLVVLSACETGLGEVQAGEGVFGLRRAFVLVGARTLVMSLWKVPDAATKKLMIKFYQNLIYEGQSRADALRNAQLELKKSYPQQPYYWGAFICQGNPGPMPR